MKNLLIAASLAMLTAGAANAGIADNVRIAPDKTFALGGSTPGHIVIDGQNRGAVTIQVLLQSESGVTPVQTLQPREKFTQSARKNETVLFRTQNGQPAKLYWHISGYSDDANPRFF